MFEEKCHGEPNIKEKHCVNEDLSKNLTHNTEV